MHLLLLPKHVGPSSCFLSRSVPFPLPGSLPNAASSLRQQWPGLCITALMEATWWESPLHHQTAPRYSASPFRTHHVSLILSHGPSKLRESSFHSPSSGSLEDPCLFEGEGGILFHQDQFPCNFKNSFWAPLQASHEEAHNFFEETDILHLLTSSSSASVLSLCLRVQTTSYFPSCRKISFILYIWATIFYVSFLLTKISQHFRDCMLLITYSYAKCFQYGFLFARFLLVCLFVA